jgi:energy-coupling factor transporter transmembrane protein EcfT
MAYADKPGPLSVPDTLSSTGHDPPIDNAQVEALLLKINALSNTIAQVNTSLHSKIDTEIKSLIARGNNGIQPQPQVTLSPIELAAIWTMVWAALWVAGAAILQHNASILSEGHQAFVPKLILFTLLAANFVLVVVLVSGPSMRWYIYVLYIVWPVQVALGVKVLTEKVSIEVGGKGEKK